MKSDES
ncbi:hypothetical protein VCHC50A2_1739A, partial [Vibrio cholerae HC-50A2]